MTNKLIAFHGDKKIKEKYLKRLQLHSAADEIIKGRYWEGGKGCAVGCTIHSSSHRAYETELGIPIIIAYLEDRIFENLPNEEAKEFPIKFLKAIPVGADLDKVWRKFFAWLLIDEKEGVIKFAKNEMTRKAIQDVGAAFNDSLVKEVPIERWWAVRYAADAASAAYAASA